MSNTSQGSVIATLVAEVDCIMWPDDAAEFVKNWIIVRQVDRKDEKSVPSAIYFHIRKRNESDPAGKIIIDSLGGTDEQ